MDLGDLKAFDEFVKNSLDKVEIPYDAASWSNLHEKWSQVSDLPIDELVEEALTDLEVPYDASSWESLHSKWSQVEDVPVDDLALASLSSFEVPYEPASWDAMHSKWSASEAAEIDQISREAASNLSVPYEPASWAVLLERLENVEYKRRLIALKMLEAAVVILLLITIGRYTGPILESRNIDKTTTPQQHHKTPPKAEKSASDVQEMAIISEPTNQEARINSQADLAETAAKQVVSTNQHHLDATESKDALVKQNFNGLPPTPVAKNQLAGSVEGPSVVNSPAIEQRQSALQPTSNQLVAQHDAKVVIDDIAWISHQVDFQRNDKINGTAMDLETPNLDVVQTTMAPIAAQKILRTRVGLYSQISRHRLQSNVPFTRGEVFQQDLVDVGGGFMTNLQFGRLGLDLGLGYEKMVFSAPNRYLLAPNEIHKVQLPIHLRFNVIHNHRLNVYAKAGVAAHGVIFARYHEAATTLRGPQAISESRFNDGLLVDGGLKDNNFFLMKNVGIGADGMVSKDVSVFAEALYQDNLSGSMGSLIGGDRHTMESVSLLVGVLYHFD